MITVSFSHKPAFKIIGFTRTINKAMGGTECPDFWIKGFKRKYHRTLSHKTARNEVEKAILDNNIGTVALTLDGGISFDYVIGGIYEGGSVPEGLAVYDVPEYDWVCFKTSGPMPDCLIPLYDYVWGKWFPEQTDYEVADMLDVGYFTSPDWDDPAYRSTLCIPVRKVSKA